MGVLEEGFLSSERKTLFQHAVSAINLMLISAGVISSVLKVKEAVIKINPTYYLSQVMAIFSSLMDLWPSKGFLSSPLYMCIAINFMVILIVISTKIQHHRSMENIHGDHDGVHHFSSHHHIHLHTPGSRPPRLSPPPAPPPSSPQHHDESCHYFAHDMTIDSVATVTTATTTKATGGSFKTTTTTTSVKISPNSKDLLKNQDVNKVSGGNIQDYILSCERIEGEKKERLKNMRKAQSFKSSTTTFPTLNPTNPTPPVKNVYLDRGGEKLKVAAAMAAEVVVEEEEKNIDQETDSMDAMWHAIKGGEEAQRKQLKKSDTWPTNTGATPRRTEAEEEMNIMSSGKEMKKSATFNDTVSAMRRGGLIRRDSSMNAEELKMKFEEFIWKFKNDLRLQRQESEQRFLEMINRS